MTFLVQETCFILKKKEKKILYIVLTTMSLKIILNERFRMLDFNFGEHDASMLFIAEKITLEKINK